MIFIVALVGFLAVLWVLNAPYGGWVWEREPAVTVTPVGAREAVLFETGMWLVEYVDAGTEQRKCTCVVTGVDVLRGTLTTRKL